MRTTSTAAKRFPGAVLRPLVVAVAFFVVRGAVAGDMLSAATLVKESDAVVVVDNRLDGAPVVGPWLRPPTSALPLGDLAGLCVPSRKILQQWLASHPKHPGRATWQRLLQDGHSEQVVFLRARDGVLRPMCETEVMFARSFAAHAGYAAFRAEVDAALTATARAAPAPASSPASSPASAPVSSPAPAPAPAPVPPAGSASSSGCL
jgi:hypothetical protein